MAELQMKAVVANGAGGPEVLAIIDRPVPKPSYRQLLIKVAAAGINRPDVLQRKGEYPPPSGASDILGLELAGTVIAIGENCTLFKPGDKIMALVHSGAYAEYVLVDEELAIAVPHSLSMIEAAAFFETYLTVYTNIFERGQLKSGETILIHGGSSGIGTTAIQLAKQKGANIIVTVGNDEKREACLALGADYAINYNKQDFVKEVEKITDGKGVDLILDMVGADYIERNISAAAVDGRIVQIAFLNGSTVNIDLMPIMLKRITYTGSTLRARSLAMKTRLVRNLEKDIIPGLKNDDFKPVIFKTFQFEQVKDAHLLMEQSHHIGKIVLIIDPQQI